MKATLINIKQETNDVKTFRFKLGNSFSFKPGQFIILTLKKDSETIKRSYSISSSPTKDYIEITVKRTGKGSHMLHELKVDGEIEINGPYGKFTFEDATDNLVLIGAGTGIAPLMSMIRYVLEKDLKIKITLIYSAKTPQDIIFKQELNNIQRQNFKYIQTITQDETWSGIKGRINIELLKDNIGMKDNLYYICGPPKMVSDVVDVLESLSIDEKNIKTERFE